MEFQIDSAQLQARNGIAVADRWLASSPHGKHYPIKRSAVSPLSVVSAGTSEAQVVVAVKKGVATVLRVSALIVSPTGLQTVTGVVRIYVNGVEYSVLYQGGLPNVQVGDYGAGQLRGRQINASVIHTPEADATIAYKVQVSHASGYAVRNSLFEVC